MKQCLNCNKEIVLPPNAHCYLKSNFKHKKFCNDTCRIEFNNKLSKKRYILKETEHNLLVKRLNALIQGKITYVKGIKGEYSPDIIHEEKDYELELFRKSNHLKEKARKWDKYRKHILVVSISDQSKTLFDEVYYFDGKNLIKEK